MTKAESSHEDILEDRITEAVMVGDAFVVMLRNVESLQHFLKNKGWDTTEADITDISLKSECYSNILYARVYLEAALDKLFEIKSGLKEELEALGGFSEEDEEGE
jgi:hypothetical protein